MISFGSVEAVQALSPYLRAGGASQPTQAQIQQWLDERSARLISWLAAAGYNAAAVKSNDIAKQNLDVYANNGAACDAERSQRNGGGDEDDENQRHRLFCAEFSKAEAWIASKALEGLGLTAAGPTRTATTGIGRIAAGTEYVVRR